jgi:hypothetical protein
LRQRGHRHEQAKNTHRIARLEHHWIAVACLFADAFAAAGIDGFYRLMDADFFAGSTASWPARRGDVVLGGD